ncbi:translation initiation factor IF-2 isoform X2 [Clupea harengus]|uniref:Translation initiation factor IF-2 isoform X2 n=1 Tax=Clupea harengus TaxID=7950 RepID=A0A6P8EYW6_CLUHA|nr:translation initiation factor IF-2 isoform X2 [Clupea harengus]
MTEKHQTVSKLKRRKTSLEDCKPEQLHRTLPRESIGVFLAQQEQPSCKRACDPSGALRGQEWWAQSGLSPLERLWAITLQAFSAQPPETSSTELLPELPPPLTPTCAREKRAEWRWCCLDDEVGALPEMPVVAQHPPVSSASSGQPVPVAPANAVPTETTCLSDRAAPKRMCAGAGARARAGGEEGRQRSATVSVPTSQRCHQSGDKGLRGVGMATTRPATSSASSLAVATDTRTRGGREPAAGTAATATASVTLETFFSAGRGGGGGGGGGVKKEGIKQRPPTDHQSGTGVPPTPSAGQQGASVEAKRGGGAGARDLDCCPMCLMPFPAGFSQMDCDGHLAQCLSEMNTDMMW